MYSKWLDKKYFHAEVDETKKPFTIVIPPPNITGQLHMGHALDNTMQDILIRFKRMQGYNALWQPGTDHASIATEVKIIDKLKSEGIDKEDLGREGFLEKAWEWKAEYGGRIIEQLKKLGSSCDWDRERFTMDEGCSKAVEEVFIRLYEKGYIYKGSRIINWCPVCQTSISDAEVEHENQAGHFWHIKYPIVGTDRFIEIATTRPETMLGDTAIAVHPEDERYADVVGKMALLPLVNREIPIVADSYVDKEFGTGAVKITPAHDPNDFEVGKRNNLPEINVMNDDATINELGGKYAGMDRYEARKQIVADLKELGYLVKIEDHEHNVGIHDRCHTTIEPLIKQQWFVKMEELAKPAIETLKKYYTFDEATGMFTNVPTLTYLYNTAESHKAIGEYLQAALAGVGVTMNLENQEWATFLETRKNGDYSVARNGWVADYNDPICFLDTWVTVSGNNDVQYGKGAHADLAMYDLDLTAYGYDVKVEDGTWAETYDVLIQTIKSCTDNEVRYALMHVAEDMLMSTGCIVPLYFYTDLYMIDDSVKGFYSNPLGYKYFMYTTVE